MITEVWKDIPGYEGLYKASSLGKVYSMQRKRLLNGHVRKEGYLQITLKSKGVELKNDMQRIIYRTFNGAITSEDIIHHKDENKLNNRLDNLEKTNRSDHKLIHSQIGAITRFKIIHNFSSEQIEYARSMYENGYGCKFLAIKLQCSEKTIERMLKKNGVITNKYSRKF